MMPEPVDDYDEDRHIAFQEEVIRELQDQRERHREILERLRRLEKSDQG